ncbi:MAG: hypothetical protein ACREGI_03985 [Candidatus Levyibacteriota bacterium]
MGRGSENNDRLPYDWAPIPTNRYRGQETGSSELLAWIQGVLNGSIKVSRRTTVALLVTGGVALAGAGFVAYKVLEWLKGEQQEPLKSPQKPTEIALGTSHVTLTTVERTGKDSQGNDVVVVDGAVFRTDPRKPNLDLGDRYNVIDSSQIQQVGFANPASGDFRGVDWPKGATTLSLTIDNLAIVEGENVDGTAEYGRWGMLDLKMHDGSIKAGYFYIGGATQGFVDVPFGGISEVKGFQNSQYSLSNIDLTPSTLPVGQVNLITALQGK